MKTGADEKNQSAGKYLIKNFLGTHKKTQTVRHNMPSSEQNHHRTNTTTLSAV
jgi:hypothetical protein